MARKVGPCPALHSAVGIQIFIVNSTQWCNGCKLQRNNLRAFYQFFIQLKFYEIPSKFYDIVSTFYDIVSTFYDILSTFYDIESTFYDILSKCLLSSSIHGRTL